MIAHYQSASNPSREYFGIILTLLLITTVSSRILDVCTNCACWNKREVARSRGYGNITLPNVSIIITLFNEEPQLLKKTLDSLWNATPGYLIHEVILVDDHSDKTDFLREISEKQKKLHYVRNEARHGLIRSRMIGARLAQADVLVFLDSHVSTDPNWLQPLLARLVHIRNLNIGKKIVSGDDMTVQPLEQVGERLVVSPVVYDLSDPVPSQQSHIHGGFTWDFTFRWEYIDTFRTPDSRHEPFSTPAISGGIFATWKRAFFQMGGYDEEMNIWGGENIELSLRTWMCHGRMEIVPCSRVGHVYREEHPYQFPKGKQYTIIKNLKRAALVWLIPAEHNLEYYDKQTSALYLSRFYSARPTSVDVAEGDLTMRRKLGSSLKCRSFLWYLERVYPQLKSEAIGILVDEFTYQKALESIKSHLPH